MHCKSLFPAVLIALGAFPGLFSAPLHAAATEPLVTVNGKPVPRSRLDFIIKEQVRQGRPATPELAREARDELVSREVLAQEAERRLGRSEQLKVRLDFMRQQALVNALREDFFLNTRPDAAEVRKLYDDMTGRAGEREYRVRHILLEDEARAQALIEQLGRGARFEELARLHSTDPASAGAGGLLAWMLQGGFVPEFGAVLPTLSRGAVAGQPVKTAAGWHVIRLEDVRAAPPPKFEDVQPRLVESLIERKWRQYVLDLQARAIVK